MNANNIYAIKFRAGEGSFKVEAEALSQQDRDTLRVFPGDVVNGYFTYESIRDGDEYDDPVNCQVTYLLLSTDNTELELAFDDDIAIIIEEELEKDSDFCGEAMDLGRDAMDYKDAWDN